MTDMDNGFSQDQGTTVSTPVSNVSEQAQTQSSEKLLKQSEVNDIVGRAKHEAIERYKREQSQYSNQAPSQQTSQGLGQDEIRRLAAEEAKRLRDEWIQQAEQTRHQQEVETHSKKFSDSIGRGRSKYEDFDSKTNHLNWEKYGHSILLINSMDNAEDIIYDIGNNPLKLVQLEQIAERDPNIAYRELKKLSESIKENDKATKTKIPNEPLSQLKPSNTGTDNGVLTVRDLRAKYRV